jgi:hypothetical protein
MGEIVCVDLLAMVITAEDGIAEVDAYLRARGGQPEGLDLEERGARSEEGGRVG